MTAYNEFRERFEELCEEHVGPLRVTARHAEAVAAGDLGQANAIVAREALRLRDQARRELGLGVSEWDLYVAANAKRAKRRRRR